MKNKKLKVALVKPKSSSFVDGGVSKFPLELMALASALKNEEFIQKVMDKNGESAGYLTKIDVQIYDLSSCICEKVLDEAIKSISMHDVVGITLTTSQINYTEILTNRIKILNPSITTIIGGAHATLSKGCINDPYVDYINIGEGVESFTHFCALYSTKNKLPPNIIKNNIQSTPNHIRNYIPAIDLHSYPLPSDSYSLLDISLYDRNGFIAHNGKIKSPIALIQTSIGCMSSCSFCAIKSIYSYLRFNKINRIVQDINNYVKQGVKLFHIVDDTFSYPPERPLELADKLNPMYKPGEIEWVFNFKADKNTTKFFTRKGGANLKQTIINYLKRLKDGHCCGLSIGVETADHSLLKSVNKDLDLNLISEITRLAPNIGIGIKWYLLLGLPEQNKHSIEKTINFMRASPPTGLAVSYFIPHLGTKLYHDKRLSFNKVSFENLVSCPEPKDRYSKHLKSPISTKTMTAKELTYSRNTIINIFNQIKGKAKLCGK